MISTRVSTALLCCCVALAAHASYCADVEVQKLQRERDQQQRELQLKMQQQQDRALRGTPEPAMDFHRRELERAQQQRQQQVHEQQSREAIAQPDDTTMRGIEQERAAQEQLQRFGIERRIDSNLEAGPAPGALRP